MSDESTLSRIKTYAISLAVFLAFVAFSVLLIVGAVKIGEKVLPWLTLVSILALGFNILILGPMALMRSTRGWAGLGFFISSYVFGLTGWFMGLLLTWMLWGGFAVFIGLFLMGIGVVPIAMGATLFKHMWAELGLLVLAVVLTFGLRILGMTLAENEEKRLNSMDAELSGTQKKSTKWHYFWLYLLLAMFLVWMASFLFNLVSHLAFSGTDSWPMPGIVIPVFFIFTIAADWNAVLVREPHSEKSFERKQRRFSLITGTLFGLVGIASVLGGKWEGHRREEAQRIDSFIAQITPFAEIGNKVSAIKSRDFISIKDYLEAYGEIESLLPEWKRRLDNVTKGIGEIRGYKLDARTSSIVAEYAAALEIGRKELSLTEKEIDTIKQMSMLPESKRVTLWEDKFKPLLHEEDTLATEADVIRKQLSTLSAGASSTQK